MAYFPNGTSGMVYEEQWCVRCIHCPVPEQEKWCAVWDAHQSCNYDQCKDPKIKILLEILIPTGKDGFPEKCTMFIPSGDVEGQRRMF